MLKVKPLQKSFSMLLTALYLFVTLFSQNFHNHGSNLIFKDFHFKNSEAKKFSKADKITSFEDCLSCHIYTEGNALLPRQTEYLEKSEFYYSINYSFNSGNYNFSKLFNSFLRGPPSTFI